MYYSAGTYESFAHPEKPKDVDKKSAYIIGTGLAGLTAAFYLVRDGQMKGEHIHLLEKLELAGGSCDGRKDITKGFYMRGGREMDNHFEVMWDTFRDVPSIETPGVSVLDEYYWLNKHDPNYSLCRATVRCGEDAHTDKKFELDKESAMALSQLFLTQEKDLEDKKISDILPDSFWSTNFWLYWQTMFAFQRWSSALEMKRYLCRYVHHIDGLPDFSALRFTKYNQYDSMILPLVKYLEAHNVRIEYGMDVKNVIIETVGDKKIAKQIVYVKDGKEQTIDLVEDDLVFITNGCCTDTSCYGDQTHVPDLSGVKNGAGELVVNSIDTDGVKNGFDLELLDAVAARCAVPIIASGGAGKKEDFLELFRNHPAVDAGLAASIFHTKQVEINDLKRYLRENGVEMRVGAPLRHAATR